MKKLKILFITKDHSEYMTKNFYYFALKLSKLTYLELWHSPGDITEILKTIQIYPDFILLNDLRPHELPQISGLSSVNIPLGIIVEDVHNNTKERRAFIKKNNIKNIFSITRDKFYECYLDLKDRMYWLPHWVNIDIFRNYGLTKDINYLIMGSVSSKYYPLRNKIFKTLKREPGFVYHKHPGYTNIIDSNAFIGEKYAREINRAKIFFTDGGIYNYPVKKYYEVLACKTLLLAPSFKELEDLGFIPGVHFVDVDENNFLEKAKYYLQYDKEREEIAQKGYEMVRAKHSVDIRVSQFVKIIEDIMK